MMGKIQLNPGDTFTLSKTVSESDVYLFAGITGDFHPNHVNEAYMKESVYGTRIVHGALGVGFISAASSVALDHQSLRAVSAGYDHIRFIRAILIGDTITVKYTVESKDEEAMKTVADVQILNSKGEVCTVAKHIAKYFED
ncbi:MaoC/PaaZ C-terminal domain-containing protein [uncultured Oscillibacter sp.]|uniref:MaoC/PaaZ C-terminal domain-containing protein n=1 Tax=uncultured Oscillibacter sp. TaxID=876091 RepID=UPI00262D9D79|nr:MaoC/PaaZ C-terminal domain-containing protein [uncultured Oscillibacter sp.]